MPSPRGASELKRLTQKQDRWAAMTASLEKELEAARGDDKRRGGRSASAQVHRERHELGRSARELWQDALEIKPQDPRRSIARWPSWPSAKASRTLVAETLRKQLKAAREKVEKLNLLRRLAQLYDERLRRSRRRRVGLSRDPGAAARRSRRACAGSRAAYEQERREAAEPRLIEVLETHAQAAATPAERRPLLHRLAAIYEARRDVAQAADRLERVLKLDKHDVKAQDALARLYAKLEKWPEAAMALERTAARAPVGPDGLDAWKRFARIVDGKLGDANRALRAWREVLERRPTDREALEALSKLRARAATGSSSTTCWRAGSSTPTATTPCRWRSSAPRWPTSGSRIRRAPSSSCATCSPRWRRATSRRNARLRTAARRSRAISTAACAWPSASCSSPTIPIASSASRIDIARRWKHEKKIAAARHRRLARAWSSCRPRTARR